MRVKRNTHSQVNLADVAKYGLPTRERPARRKVSQTQQIWPKPKRVRKLSENPQKPLVHGRQGWLRGCDCEECKAGHAAYMREYRARKRPVEQLRPERQRAEPALRIDMDLW